jgi:hypothetical protein
VTGPEFEHLTNQAGRRVSAKQVTERHGLTDKPDDGTMKKLRASFKPRAAPRTAVRFFFKSRIVGALLGAFVASHIDYLLDIK